MTAAIDSGRDGAVGDRPELRPRQAAIAIFSRQLRKLIASTEVTVETDDTDVTRSMTRHSLAQHQEAMFPDVPLSKSGIYRLAEGKAMPRLDQIIALARIFGVPAAYFVTDGYPDAVWHARNAEARLERIRQAVSDGDLSGGELRDRVLAELTSA